MSGGVGLGVGWDGVSPGGRGGREGAAHGEKGQGMSGGGEDRWMLANSKVGGGGGRIIQIHWALNSVALKESLNLSLSGNAFEIAWNGAVWEAGGRGEVRRSGGGGRRWLAPGGAGEGKEGTGEQ